VIYPEGVWYQYHNTNDIDEIIQQHLIEGRTVERLKK
jgi:(2Fe-2S) ferredoxin